MLRMITLCVLYLCVCASAYAQGVQANVSFTFDDVPRSVYTQAYPLLKKAGMRGTVYVSTGLIGLTGYLTWGDIKDLDTHGWEIAAHAHSHNSLRKMSDQEMYAEMLHAQALFLERGFIPVSFSAPMGEYAARELAVIQKTYTSNRAAWGNNGINSYPSFDRYNIVSFPITLTTTLTEIDLLLEQIKREGGWLVLQFHQIDNGQADEPAYSKESLYSTRIFPEILDLVLQKKIAVRTVGDIVAQSLPK